MIIRSYANGFELADYTQEIVNIPNQWGLIQRLGLFESQGITTNTAILEEQNFTIGLITDRVRGERNNVSKDGTRKMRSFVVPHFPLDDYIGPKDIAGKRAYGGEQAETLAAVRLRKMERIRKSHAATLETARAAMIGSGLIYAPNGTVVGNMYTEFGVTRKEVDFALGTGTTNVIGKCEEVIAHIQDNVASGEIPERIIGLASPAFFSSLINHATVKTAYTYYQSEVEPLRKRLGDRALGLDGRFRSFDFGGILFIEYRGNFSGYGDLITASECRFVPLGLMDSFSTYFSPAEKFDLVNTEGQELYMFEYPGEKGDKIEIETESNFLNLVARPQVVVRGY